MAEHADRLRALDLAWLEMEGDGPPIAIGTVAVAEGPPPAADEVIAMIAERLPRMAGLHLDLGLPAWGLRRPTWIEADAIDVSAHVHTLAAATFPAAGAPGRVASDRRAASDRLEAAVGWIMQQPLARDRPLWDAWIVTGLDPAGQGEGGPPDGPWALVWRVHHSIVDGVGALLLLGHGFDVDRHGGPTMAERVRADWAQSRQGLPTPASQRPQTGTGEAIEGDQPGGAHLPGPGWAAELTAHTLGWAADVAGQTLGHLAAALPSVLPRPPGPLTGPVGPGRAWVHVEIPLADVRAIRRTLDVTVNDAVLAGVAGGFRALLLSRDESVAGRTVRNLVPVSRRAPGDDSPANQLSALLAHLPVGIADPVERLHAVTTAVRHARAVGEPVLASALLGFVDRAVPVALQDPAVATLGRTVPAWFMDTLTTNVPGPQFPIYTMGRAVSGLFPIIPVAGHTAITTGIFSYDGTLDVGITGDADLAGDVAVLAVGIRGAIDELAALVG